ncbi:MAG: DUF3025 domain-containing protein [Sterolibacterium sp.]|jgi:hypothetical protein|nr:DUF3025 domain-containing protein [Sterolibacterium sp.]
MYTRQPLYAPLRSLLDELQIGDAPPSLGLLNERAAAAGLSNAAGKPLRFVAPHGSGLGYEERVWWLGEVETRPGNWHDAFNALVWLAFPQTKAALNQRHHQELAAQRHATPHVGQRGLLRDALTQFDECGVLVAGSDLALWEGIRAHRWKDVFWTQREHFCQSLRVFVFGHASYDLLRHPHLGLCGKAAFLHVDAAWLTQTIAQQQADIDVRLAQRFHADGFNGYTRPRDFHPLPLLGIPGATPENESALYYENTRQFRPLQVVGH